MKKLTLLIALIPCLTQAQDITGKWNGILNVQGMELRLVFHISREDSTYEAKMDSPDQKAFGIPASATHFENSVLNIEIAQLGGPVSGAVWPKWHRRHFLSVGAGFPAQPYQRSDRKEGAFSTAGT